MIAIPCIAGPILIIFLLSINTSWAFIYPLNQTCSPPVSQGGSGYCGPKFCDVSASPAAACIFTNAVINYQERISSVKSKSCVQSTDGRCTSAALAALMKGPGIKAAYCNDEFLVIISDGTPGFKTNLDSVKNPPGAVDKNGMTCVTRYTNPAFMTVKIPLNPTLLATSTAGVNNVNTNSFPNGGGDGDGAYMSLSTPGTAATYGLPTRGSVGISVAGQDIFPAFNNLAYLAPQKCEVDPCNEHVGGGGGQPHLHGDPFGSWCLYSALNYTTGYMHPPQIGWALDGPNIYGRHLSELNYGYTIPLDECGGHAHGAFPYHYHTQVLTATTDGGAVKNQAAGQTYYASTTGPYKCFKGDISLIPNFYGNLLVSHTSVLPDTTTNLCTGTTQYYTASGIVLPIVQAEVTMSPSRAPTQAPTFSPSQAPTSSPSPAPTLGVPTFLVQQVVNSVVLDTPAKKTAFTATFKEAVASNLMISSSDIVVVSVDSTRRRLENGGAIEMLDNRPFLQATGGVTVIYTVTAQSTLTYITNTINSAGFSTGVNSALSTNYPGATVASASISVSTSSPTKAPVMPVSACHKFNPNIVLSILLISVTLTYNYL